MNHQQIQTLHIAQITHENNIIKQRYNELLQNYVNLKNENPTAEKPTKPVKNLVEIPTKIVDTLTQESDYEHYAKNINIIQTKNAKINRNIIQQYKITNLPSAKS